MSDDTFQEIKQVEHGLITDILIQLRIANVKPDVVVGLSRGGLIPAVVVSHALKIPMVTLQWSTRDYAARVWPTYATEATRDKIVLVIDDINDSGMTFKSLKEHLPGDNVYWASLYQRDGTCMDSDFVGDYIHDEVWVNFSWEVEGKSATAEVEEWQREQVCGDE
jgi:uncharacterized protein